MDTHNLNLAQGTCSLCKALSYQPDLATAFGFLWDNIASTGIGAMFASIMLKHASLAIAEFLILADKKLLNVLV